MGNDRAFQRGFQENAFAFQTQKFENIGVFDEMERARRLFRIRRERGWRLLRGQKALEILCFDLSFQRAHTPTLFARFIEIVVSLFLAVETHDHANMGPAHIIAQRVTL